MTPVILPEDKHRVTSAIWLSIMALVAGAIAVGSLLFLFITVKSWALQKNNVVCVPVNVKSNHPFIYKQTQISPTESDALIKRFALDYIHLTKDESIANYYAATNDARYSDSMLSSNKWKAIHLSKEEERARNMQSFYKSSELVPFLKTNNAGWTFLPDEIIVRSAMSGNSFYVTVRGEYQLSRDAAKTRLPNEFNGYKEIDLYIDTAPPSKDEQGEFINGYGMYVFWSSTRDITALDREEISKEDNFDTKIKE